MRKASWATMAIAMAVLVSALGAVAGIGSGTAQATPPASQCDNGQTYNPNAGECQPNGTQVTICHVAGLAEDPANTVTLTIALVAAVGPAGHFNEDGTTQAGHEQDYWGPCETTPPPPELVWVCTEDDEIVQVPIDEADDPQYHPTTPPNDPEGHCSDGDNPDDPDEPDNPDQPNTPDSPEPDAPPLVPVAPSTK